ncbi:MAG: c-type cytochrome domain-containing protein [Verrucomicrobiota bacterium]
MNCVARASEPVSGIYKQPVCHSRDATGSRAAPKIVAAALFLALASAAQAAPDPPAPVDFARDIRPILESSCLRCHGLERPKSGFRLTSREAALKGGDNAADDIIPGDSRRSRLVEYVSGSSPDLQMPPAGKGAPLAPAQVDLLRAWIDQGASWGEPVAYPQSASKLVPELSWIHVSGNSAQFRSIEGTRGGWGGGLEEFSLEQQDAADRKFVLNGRVLGPDQEVRLEARYDWTDAGTLRAGVDHWTKYFTGTGGYAPLLVPSIYSLNQDLHLDFTRFWTEGGLSVRGWPQVLVGFEYLQRSGKEATLQWGPVGTQPPFPAPTDAKNIFPATQQIEEDTSVFRLDASYAVRGWQLTDAARVELYRLGTRRQNLLNFPAPGVEAIIDENNSHVQGANTLSVRKQLAPWCGISAGYFYSQLDGQSSLQQSTVDGGAPSAGDQWSANDLTLKRQSQAASASSLLGPWKNFTLSVGVQGEWTSQSGAGLENLAFGLPAQPPDTTEQSTVEGRYDSALSRESLGLRFTGIPHTVAYAESRLEQEHLNRLESRPGGSFPFYYDGDENRIAANTRLGFSTSPWPRWMFRAEVRHADGHVDYPTPILTNSPPFLYPGFFSWRDIATDEAQVRLVYRWTSWMRTSFTWRRRSSWYSSAAADATGTVPPGQIQSGHEQADIYSADAVWTPARRLFVSALFSFSNSRTATAQNGADYLAPWQGQVYSAILSGNYAFDSKTSITGSYGFSQSDFAQNLAATGLPLGINYQRDVAQLALRRQWLPGLATTLGAAFYWYHEPTSGSANNYTGEGVFGSLSWNWL